MAGWLYVLDSRREAEEKRRSQAETLQRRAEGAAQELRRLVEASIGKGHEQRDSWTRPMLQLPLKQATCERVFQVFDAALDEATQALRGVVPDADPSSIRANLFLPTSEHASDGVVCDLIIPRDDLAAPEGLQRNMRKGDELSISFRPNEGATGRAFVQRRAIGTLTNPGWLAERDPSKKKRVERWIYVRLHPEADFRKAGGALLTESGQFVMTDFQNRRVSESLVWIISMPIVLKTDDIYEVVGVFNVDCLEYQLKPEQLRALYYRVAPFAGALAGVLCGLPTDRVAILRFRGDRK
jgi:hypothetical protein